MQEDVGVFTEQEDILAKIKNTEALFSLLQQQTKQNDIKQTDNDFLRHLTQVIDVNQLLNYFNYSKEEEQISAEQQTFEEKLGLLSNNVQDNNVIQPNLKPDELKNIILNYAYSKAKKINDKDKQIGMLYNNKCFIDDKDSYGTKKIDIYVDHLQNELNKLNTEEEQLNKEKVKKESYEGIISKEDLNNIINNYNQKKDTPGNLIVSMKLEDGKTIKIGGSYKDAYTNDMLYRSDNVNINIDSKSNNAIFLKKLLLSVINDENAENINDILKALETGAKLTDDNKRTIQEYLKDVINLDFNKSGTESGKLRHLKNLADKIQKSVRSNQIRTQQRAEAQAKAQKVEKRKG